MANVDIEEKNC